MTTSVTALSVPQASASFETTTIERRDLRPNDVRIDIQFAGICHSDIHQVRGEWGGETFPMVPGHEIIGTVAEVGSEVTDHQVGDTVGVGCFVDSCLECAACKDGEEQYCTRGVVQTYNDQGYDGEKTFGGYSQQVVTRDHFVVRIRRAWTSRPPRRCCAPGSRRTTRSRSTTWARARASASSAWVASATSP